VFVCLMDGPNLRNVPSAWILGHGLFSMSTILLNFKYCEISLCFFFPNRSTFIFCEVPFYCHNGFAFRRISLSISISLGKA